MLIIICGCDVLKCKAHLNPAANYRMFCGVSAAEVGLGLSRGLKHKNWHQLNVKSVLTGGGALFCHVPNKPHDIAAGDQRAGNQTKQTMHISWSTFLKAFNKNALYSF